MEHLSPISFANGGEETVAPLPAGGESLAEVHLVAKLLVALFGVLLVIALPIGAIISEGGILTRPDPAKAPEVGYAPIVQNQPIYPKGQPVPVRPNRPVQPGVVAPPAGSVGQNPSVPMTAEQRKSLSDMVLNYADVVRSDAIDCRALNGTITSGAGGMQLCVQTKSQQFVRVWPSIPICGPAPGDTQWMAFRGDTDTWDITVTCTERPGCNGPTNALCNKDGCKFSESCLPK